MSKSSRTRNPFDDCIESAAIVIQEDTFTFIDEIANYAVTLIILTAILISDIAQLVQK